MLVELRMAKDLGVKRLKVFTNFQLVAEQAREEYKSRELIMIRYLQKLHSLKTSLKTCFDYFEIFHIPRMENARADALSRLATTGYEELDRTFVEHLNEPSIYRANEIQQVTYKLSWMDAYINHLIDGSLPSNPSEARQIKWTTS